MTFLILK
ncbi:hypothetical protein VCHENC02_0642A, partial [Vibrio harveyi]